MHEERSIHRVQVRTAPHVIVVLPWESAQALQAHLIAAYPTVHPVVERFRAVGVSRPVELEDPADRDFIRAVLDAWADDVGDDRLPPRISELRDALRGDAD